MPDDHNNEKPPEPKPEPEPKTEGPPAPDEAALEEEIRKKDSEEGTSSTGPRDED